MAAMERVFSSDNISAGDISVFVFTYKRPELLKRTLKSLIEQTSSGFEIIVFDNSQEKEAAPVCCAVQVKCVNTCFLNNWEISKRFMKKKYTLILHDDDVLHSRYMEICLKALNKFKGLAVISPCKSDCPVDSYPDLGKSRLKSTGILCSSKTLYAALSRVYCYLWSGSMVKSDIYRKAFLNPSFGKIADMPMLFELLKQKNSALILTDRKAVYYGIHEGQYSNNKENGLSRLQSKEYIKYMYSTMACGGNSFARAIFLLSVPKMFYVINLKFLKEEFSVEDIDLFLRQFRWSLMEKLYISRYKSKLCAFVGIFIRGVFLVYIKLYLSKLRVNF